MGSNSKPIEILLADDDLDDRDLFLEALNESAVVSNLRTFENGKQLTDFISEIKNPPPPDVIFLDINMPYKDGRACLREIRKKTEFQNVPIIMFSTSAHNRDIEDTYKSGANLYLPKDVFFENDVTILKNLFSGNWSQNIISLPKEKFVLKK